MSTKETGSWGETLAAEYLKARGGKILETNWRCRFGEIDLIAEQNGMLLFVEVKLRSNLQYGMPREFVTAGKQKKLRAAASLYLSRLGADVPARFDVAEVCTDAQHSAEGTRISYIEDAF